MAVRSTAPYSIPYLQPPIRRTVSAEGIVTAPLIGLGLIFPTSGMESGMEEVEPVARALDYEMRAAVPSTPARRGPLNASVVLC